MAARLNVVKTYKLFIDGKFPRSESGRSLAVPAGGGGVAAHVCRASRKDVRDAVSAARRALPGWSGASAYLRGQILYRIAEMLEGKKSEFVAALAVERVKGARVTGLMSPAAEVERTIDRFVSFAGWADKYAQVLGCQNPVAGPYYNFTVPGPVGVVAVLGPDRPGLLGLGSLVAPALCAGNSVVALAGESAGARLAACVLGEVIATSDVPAGVVNVLTGERAELAPVIAGHRDIDGVLAARGSASGLDGALAGVLEAGAAENLKRVRVYGEGRISWDDDGDWSCPERIEDVVEAKTIWHPSSM